MRDIGLLLADESLRVPRATLVTGLAVEDK